MKRASISDVAQRAGVSTATVSRVLNDPDRVSEATRDKVREAISELNFVKSATAFSFKVSQTHNILAMVANIGSIYYSEVFEGMQRKAEEHGYGVIISSTPPGEQFSWMVTDRLRSGRVDGIIVLDGAEIQQEDYAILKKIYGGTPPLVGFSEKRDHLLYPHVLIDNRRASREATQQLIDAGHTAIGHITAPPNFAVAGEREAGFRAALEAAGLEVNEKFIFDGGFHIPSGRSAVREMLKLKDQPTALFCANDELAMGAVSELSGAGIRVPDDFSVVGYDDICLAEAYVPALTTIRQPRHEIGAATMALLLDVMRAPDAGDDRVIEKKLHLIVRDSVGPPKNR
jgi:LacI family transcriptional regulator, repressor for deo operon, udp, cdd, tsx, nupC, and nupG